jgi:hypothetical protein
MSNSEFEAKSPAWHMARIRESIKAAKGSGCAYAEKVEERRQYWLKVQKMTSGF